MGWLDRVRGVATPDARVRGLRDELETARALRVPLYLNEQRTAHVFAQRRGNVTQVISGGNVGIEISGGPPGVITARHSQASTTSSTLEITPLMQALLLEETERERGELVDLSAAPPKSGAVLYFVGAGHLFGPWEQVSARDAVPALDSAAASRLEALREKQTHRMRFTDPDLPGMLVWYARGVTPLVSIASMRAVEGGALASYAPYPPFGILGVSEGRSEGFDLIAPLMIWHAPAG